MTQPAPPSPLQASDPARLTDGQIVPRYVPPPLALADSFRVDLAEAPTAIARLTQAAEDLRALRRDAESLGRVSPPANDPVSHDAAQLLGATATGGPGSLIAAIDGGLAELERLAASLRADLDSYGDVEQRNSSRAQSRT